MRFFGLTQYQTGPIEDDDRPGLLLINAPAIATPD
jgi:hypothetical protein